MEHNSSTTAWNEDLFWQAVLEKNTQFNGRFVYGVRSTGIYCNPGCPSRRPNREQVRFFATPAEAQSAGFRSCKRCHPDDLTQNEQVEMARKICDVLDTHPDQPCSLEMLGQELHRSPSYIQRVFKSIMGVTPRQYMANQKLQAFKSQVKAGQDVTTALYDAGYSSTSRLYEGVNNRMGMTPAVYRQGGAGKSIYYTIVKTYLGQMLVAATENGVCAVSFGQEESSLITWLQTEYPAAYLQPDQVTLTAAVTSLVKHLEGALPHLSLPLDLQATAFQLRVWEELRRIPYGETRTYSQVAEAIGRPKAVRAVANACAANPVAVVTPCHRVVRSDGSLGGYRYGIERKRALLSMEKDHLEE
jgi:AraC family transcriptional regulator of adaptative response/methylated-DNA-[protein]-cysteine methyltransferase